MKKRLKRLGIIMLVGFLIYWIFFKGNPIERLANDPRSNTELGQLIKSDIKKIDADIPLEERFKFIDDEIGDSRIVALGEQSHEPNYSFELRGQLIEYLMKNKGFEVILFEAGIYDLYKANDRSHIDKSIEPLKNGLYKFWRDTEYHEPLFNYLQTRLNDKLPVEFGGFDCKLTSEFGRVRGRYVNELINEVKKASIDTTTNEVQEYFKFWRAIDAERKESKFKANYFEMTDDERARFEALSLHMQTLLKKNGKPFWSEIIRAKDAGISLYSQFSLWFILNRAKATTIANKRDVAMANTLKYLVKEKYKDKKIILIAHTYHVSSGLEQSNKEDSASIQPLPMGQIWSKSEEEKIFTIGFYEPQPTFETSPEKDFAPSLYQLQAELGYKMAYFPIHKWPLKEPDPSKQVIIDDYKHNNWPEVFDAIVLIK